MLKITDLGVWRQYEPERIPDIPNIGVLPPGVMWSRGPKGDDWYVFRCSWPAGTLCVQAEPRSKTPNAPCIIRNVTWGTERTPVPLGFRVLQIAGHDPKDPAPWKSYEGMTYDPATGLLLPAMDIAAGVQVKA